MTGYNHIQVNIDNFTLLQHKYGVFTFAGNDTNQDDIAYFTRAGIISQIGRCTMHAFP